MPEWATASRRRQDLAPRRQERIRAVARDARTDAFSIDLVAGKVVDAAGEEVHLTPKEWGLVVALSRRPGRLLLQRDLLREVWGPDYGLESNYLRVFMAQVRKKLEPDPGRPRYFITEPGLGYRFENPGEDA